MVLRSLLVAAFLPPLMLLTSAASSSPLEQPRFLQDQANDAPPEAECCACVAPDVTDEATTVQILLFDSPGIIAMVRENAEDYMRLKKGAVDIQIKTTPTLPELYAEIESDARTGGGLFDAYFTNPIIMGTAAVLNGFMDLSPYIKTSDGWTDILPVFRTHVTNFEDEIYLILLDGDTHAMFYRRDVLDHFGLNVPRTWDEYIEVAAAVHGKTFNNITLSGSCVSRVPGDHAQYWAHLVLSTITQTHGADTGSIFDTNDLTPLTGEAVAEMLRVHEESAKYGTHDEFEGILNRVQNDHMNDGSCVLTYSWGDLFKRSKAEGSVLHDKLGIAPTPGSARVLDRETGELVPCDKDRCPFGTFYEDLGWVNHAPYAANGGWGGAISANADPDKQKVLVDFFLWATGREQSTKYVVPEATLPISAINGQDPWRKSHLEVDKWVAKGFDAELSKQYVTTILQNTQSKNVVVEIRFPKSGEIMSVLDKLQHEYLYRAHVEGSIPAERRHEERLKTAAEVTRQWQNIIKAYDNRGDTLVPILEIYQRLRGVYVPNEDKNQITALRPLGFVLFGLIAVLCVLCATWVYFHQEDVVVKASQPPFLYMIAFGTLVLASSIIPLSIDDGVASEDACSMACMSTVWLLAIGFTITFSSLFTKIWRLGRVFENSRQFRRVKVTVSDVIVPLVVLVSMNVVLLIVWTALEPIQWERVQDGRSDSGEIVSYGRCLYAGTTSTILGVLLLVVNFMALALANIQAFRNRNIESEFNEGQYIGLIMASLTQAFLIGLPVLLLARNNPSTNYIVSTLLVFIICLTVLGLIFIPKYRSSKRPQRDVAQELRRSVTQSGRKASGLSGSFYQDNGASKTFQTTNGNSFGSQDFGSASFQVQRRSVTTTAKLESLNGDSSLAPHEGSHEPVTSVEKTPLPSAIYDVPKNENSSVNEPPSPNTPIASAENSTAESTDKSTKTPGAGPIEKMAKMPSDAEGDEDAPEDVSPNTSELQSAADSEIPQDDKSNGNHSFDENSPRLSQDNKKNVWWGAGENNDSDQVQQSPLSQA